MEIHGRRRVKCRRKVGIRGERNDQYAVLAASQWETVANALSTDHALQFSRPSTVQALLLLGIREFGIGWFHTLNILTRIHNRTGSMEQGWLLTGGRRSSNCS